MQIFYNSWGNIKGTHFVLKEVLVFLNINDSKTMNVINNNCTFEKNIRLKDVSFGYDENSLPAINKILLNKTVTSLKNHVGNLGKTASNYTGDNAPICIRSKYNKTN